MASDGLNVAVDAELQSLSIEQLQREWTSVQSSLADVVEQLGDLAFHNYSTYVDAGRTAQQCSQIYADLSGQLRTVCDQVPDVSDAMKSLQRIHIANQTESDRLRSTLDAESPLWEILTLPSRVDVCIRAGFYDAAFALTQLGAQLQQLDKNPLVKSVADRLVASRTALLDELLSKFSTNVDLATGIQIINRLRKVGALSACQLRLAVLTRCDQHLQKQLAEIQSQPDVVLKAVDIYRDAMYNSVVLYMAAFPDTSTAPRRERTSLDPRWESWQPSSGAALLSEWASHNVSNLLELVARAETKSAVDLSSIAAKLNAFGAVLGHLGLDFRARVADLVERLTLQRLDADLRAATQLFVGTRHLDVWAADLDAGKLSTDSSASAPHPSPQLSLWDDLAVFGNGLLEALNQARFTLAPAMTLAVREKVERALRPVFVWLAAHQSTPHFSRALSILVKHFLPFIDAVLLFFFPYAQAAALCSATTLSQQHYEETLRLDAKRLCAGTSPELEGAVEQLVEKPKQPEQPPEVQPAEAEADANPIPEESTTLNGTGVPNVEDDHQVPHPPTQQEVVIPEENGDDAEGDWGA